MPKTPDRTPGVSKEEGTRYTDEGTLSTQEGEVRYTGGRFSLFDALGEYDPRSGGAGDDPNSLFNNLNESFDILITETDCVTTSILAHAPGDPLTKIREIDNFTMDALGITTGMRIRQFDQDGTTVLETMTYNGTGWVKS